MSSNLEFNIVKKGFDWLSIQKIESVKELASTVSAHAIWGLPNPYITQLIRKKEGDSWNSSIRDTARACSALSAEGIILRAPEKWLLSRKKKKAHGTKMFTILPIVLELLQIWKFLTGKGVIGYTKIMVPLGNRSAPLPS